MRNGRRNTLTKQPSRSTTRVAATHAPKRGVPQGSSMTSMALRVPRKARGPTVTSQGHIADPIVQTSRLPDTFTASTRGRCHQRRVEQFRAAASEAKPAVRCRGHCSDSYVSTQHSPKSTLIIAHICRSMRKALGSASSALRCCLRWRSDCAHSRCAARPP